VSPEAQAGAEGVPPSTVPVIERHWTDFSPGVLRTTGNPLDLAIAGQGFFAVQGPSGRLYTRVGGFVVSRSGALATAEGYAVRAVAGGVIQVPADGPLEVARDGTVTQRGQPLGRIEIALFRDPSVLIKRGGNFFQAPDGVEPVPDSNSEIHQGKIESSNVSSAEGAVRLVSVMRQFEMIQKAIQLGGEMNRRAVEEVARVG
jgi:flagellar basal body rod protein FlgG